MNYQVGKLTFDENNILEMEFDTATMELYLRCEGQYISFVVKPPEKNDCYRFVAYLYKTAQEIELLPRQ
jgi:hypothetical protein